MRVRNADLKEDSGNRHHAQVLKYRSSSEIPWEKLSKKHGYSLRIIVQRSQEQLPLDVLYVPRDSSRLIVGFHGSINQNKMQLPVFQFQRSLRSSRDESLLLISDTTLLQEKKLRIGWTFGAADQDLSTEYTTLVGELQEQTGISETTFLGHSAGGFSAVRVGLPLDNSTCIVVNGQFDIAIHRHWEIPKIKASASSENDRNNKEFIQSFPERFDLRHSLPKRGSNSRICWFAQYDDHLSFRDFPHFPEYADEIGIPHHGGISLQGDLGVVTHYSHKPGNSHGVPGTVIPFIEASLKEPISMDLGIDFNLFPAGTFDFANSVSQTIP